ncbi:hypothetical protein MUK42_37381 [Musa troglodytarum]|uniref:Uncharacterized protein n=1 Tax=Musa troglodytarum TaxID=320322 RepID=A0A9E7G7B9_9LILI|nr:hypothetical protein MUK42_37381 [Musa troglodytarum]
MRRVTALWAHHPGRVPTTFSRPTNARTQPEMDGRWIRVRANGRSDVNCFCNFFYDVALIKSVAGPLAISSPNRHVRRLPSFRSPFLALCAAYHVRAHVATITSQVHLHTISLFIRFKTSQFLQLR